MTLGKYVPILEPCDFTCGQLADGNQCCLHGWAIVATTRKHPDDVSNEERDAAEALAIKVARRIDPDVEDISAVYSLNDQHATPKQLADAWNAEMRSRGYTVIVDA